MAYFMQCPLPKITIALLLLRFLDIKVHIVADFTCKLQADTKAVV